MRSAFEVIKPGDIEFKATFSMKLSAWVELRNQIKDMGWPTTDLSYAITDMVTQAQRVYYPKEPEEE